MVHKRIFSTARKSFPSTIRDGIPTVQAIENLHMPGENINNNGDYESYETKLLLDDANCENCRYKYWPTDRNSWCYYLQFKPKKPICFEYEFALDATML